MYNIKIEMFNLFIIRYKEMEEFGAIHKLFHKYVGK